MTTPWMSHSFTPPFTASGQAALVPPPPWHYAGWLLNVALSFDADAARPLVPPSAGRPVGRGCLHFADWQATTDGHELIDPVLAQYKETILVVEIERPDGSPCLYCPAIWVDQDISLLRGLLQGWPKKFGSTWLTRSLPLDHPAAAPLRAGTRLGASLAVKDRRLFDVAVTLSGEPGEPLGFLALPTLGAVGWADLRQPEVLPTPELLRPAIRDKTTSAWHGARAELQVYPHPGEEIASLGPLQVGPASVGWAGISIVGAQAA